MSLNTRVSCPFCPSLLTQARSVPWNTVLAENEHFLTMPSKGALVPGWVLVVAKRHTLCSGSLGADELRNLGTAIDEARFIVSRSFGHATIFEHGPFRSGTALGCGIDHMHFHVVPLSFSLVEAVNHRVPGMQWQRITGISQLSEVHRAGVGYCVVQEPAGPLVLCRPPDDIRQLLRQAIATHLGVPDSFDYAAHPQLPNVLTTVDRLSAGA
jgi:ATP adenylyltransferase